MTPWAELLLDPAAAGDAVVRRAYHRLARGEHPDFRIDRRPGPRWAAVTAAYAAVKTAAARTAWARGLKNRACLCAACKGWGVRVRVLGPGAGVAVCPACGGEGRVTK
jgi:DnaJ-class molecular chaperone